MVIDQEIIFLGVNDFYIVQSTYDDSKKEVQKITRSVPRRTVKTTARWEAAVLLFSWLFFLSRDPMKLMSLVIFEKFLRIPEEKMSPLSGKNILGRIDWKNGIAFSSFSATWIGFSFQ